MNNCFEHNTTYFLQEGKANLRECLRLSFEAAAKHDISKIVIFTGAGEGVKIAYNDFISQEQYSHIQIVAATFPQGHPHAHLFLTDDQDWMDQRKIPLIRAHLPFDPIRTQYGQGLLGQDFSLLGNVLSIFGGSMSLAVQAVLMASDAGAVRNGEHVIALTSDTSIMVRSAPTSHLLTEFIVRAVFCKAAFLDVSKKEELPASDKAEAPKLIEGEVSTSETITKSL
jgi:uncharacterized protein